MLKIISMLFLTAFTLQAEEFIKVTRDPRPDPTYVSYKSYCAEHPGMGTLDAGPEVIRPASNALLKAEKGLVALVVATNLVTPLESDLGRWVNDLEARGYTVEQSVYSTVGKVENLKSYLKTLRSQGLVGAVLVGELPAAWYQIDDDWSQDGSFDPPDDWYEELPTDLFLADLDGTWKDDSTHSGDANQPMTKGQDGIYDSHTGSIEAEIWVTRIDASQITFVDKLKLYHDFFARVHAYRQAELVFPSKGYFYVDNDWVGYFLDNKMNLVCDEIDEIRDTMLTYADDYKGRLIEDGLFMTLLVHSSPEAHYFVKPNTTDYDMFNNWLLPSLAPSYGFYNLFACSNCRWVELNCMGNLYHFTGSGLACIGSTKTGSVLDFNVFNEALGSGSTWGDAFLGLTNYWLNTYKGTPLEQWARSWFMGLCILGDGTLDLKEQKPVAVVEVPQYKCLALSVTTHSSNRVGISFNLNDGCPVRIDVYDASGRLATNVANRTFSPGDHSLEWVAVDVPSGVYFLRLSTPASTIGRKFIVSR